MGYPHGWSAIASRVLEREGFVWVEGGHVIPDPNHPQPNESARQTGRVM